MLLPLVLLAVGSAVVGFLPILKWIAPVTGEAAAHGEAAHEGGGHLVTYLATGGALLGIGAALYIYLLFTDLPRRVGQAFSAVGRVLDHKWFFDDVYNWFAARAVVDGSREVLYKAVDASVIDGAVNGSGLAAGLLAERARRVQSGMVRGYVLLILGGAVALLGYLLWLPR
jgi:NADH-quinone oxidoreductase subunit L